MDSDKKEEPGIPSLNTQVAAGVVFFGLWMFSMNRKLRDMNSALFTLAEGMVQTNYNVGLLHGAIAAKGS